MIATLVGRVSGPRRRLARFFLGRARALMGSREMPKFMLIKRMFTPLRETLRRSARSWQQPAASNDPRTSTF